MTARILIIEDEALVAMELRFVLEDLGHKVVGVASTSKSAQNLARENEVDLALVDIHLSDGPTGISLGRELGQEMGVTVLFMTANPGMVRDGVAGAIGVLSKPTDEQAVQTAVDYALRRRTGQPVQYAPPGLQLFA
ncbi:MAG: response regulator [Pseudomonadota bacterium]|jgi:DNA-binding response OmpR family regulator|uniref:DNA-binding response OmpR family regulator n=1 Tax=Brevundimonas aurantiaca TaxID=74316 RepID=A0A7W9C4F0_9CAUL|nr:MULTISPECIES: response regulator [Brevundimonas]MBB1177770.1 response regulator [Pseudomonas sp. FW305-3-2-15-E-TSA4]MEC7796366.1 response regulator [Pseudomonadota bacterium]ALJ09680.1 response regulator [Brevundimonas sp. DS20]MAL58065.1 response regulator [Brevundimonas sp.]MBA4786726.1 response regulator [Brevundimonas sp.]